MFSNFPNGMIVPFEELKEPRGVPKWWDAYNKVKHNEYKSFRDGNLENCTIALAAVILLRYYMIGPYGNLLFANVGIAYDDKSIDMFLERRMFPHR